MRSVCLDEQVRFSGIVLAMCHICLAVFACRSFLTLANPTISVRVNQSSLVVRMALCEHGGLLRRVRPRSSPSPGLGLQRLA